MQTIFHSWQCHTSGSHVMTLALHSRRQAHFGLGSQSAPIELILSTCRRELFEMVERTAMRPLPDTDHQYAERHLPTLASTITSKSPGSSTPSRTV
jgi:hypothetical protein